MSAAVEKRPPLGFGVRTRVRAPGLMKLLAGLGPFALAGLRVRPIRFLPTFHKWRDKSCGGLYLHVTDPATFQPLRTTLALITTIRRLWPAEFAWRDPPYEYEALKRPIDILVGNCRFREALERDAVKTSADLDDLLFLDKPAWRKQVAEHLLYGA